MQRLTHIKNKAEKQRDLTHSERLVLLHTLGHLGVSGKQMVHGIISHCSNYSHSRTERWLNKIPERPISCPRIREWLSDITPALGCNCRLKAWEMKYPSPLMHTKNSIDRETNLPSEIPAVGPYSNPDPALIDELDERSTEPQRTESLVIRYMDTTKIDHLIKDLFEIRNEKKQIERKEEQIEKEIRKTLEEGNVADLHTSYGKLTISDAGTLVLQL